MPQRKPAAKAVQYVLSHWKEGKSLKEIAKMHGIDPGNLARAFRKKYGCTVKQFMDEKRKALILKHLSTDDLFGHEIGTKLGFRDDLAFYRWVKRAFRASFAELRKQKLDDK